MNIFRTTLIMLCLAALAACAAPRPAALPLRDAALYPRSQTRSGLTVAVDAVNDPDREARYFGQDLIDQGILPVNIIVTNRGEDHFVVRPANVLVTGGSRVFDPVPPAQFPGNRRDRRGAPRGLENLLLRETTVPPGAGYQGFLFFRLDQREEWYGRMDRFFFGGMSIRIMATDQDSGERIQFGPFALD